MNSQQFLNWLVLQNQPLLMGVLNVTPNSFSDGGKFIAPDKACEHALRLIEQGADLIDIGGESSKPGAVPVPVEIEIARVIPVIEQLRKQSSVCISIDTYKPEVMEAAVGAGADIINDIHALRAEGALEMAARLAVPIVLMHMQGNPQTMQENPEYPNGVMKDVMSFFEERIIACEHYGIHKNRLILDPGFGFGKNEVHNLTIMKRIKELRVWNLPLLLGVSRKSTIGSLLHKEVDQRLIGGIALSVYAVLNGVGILRTHDVAETKQAIELLEAISPGHSEVALAPSRDHKGAETET